MADLNGTYLGFSPTDESAVGLGEAEMVIGDEEISFRCATGLKIESFGHPRADFRELTPEDIAGMFDEGAPIKGITGLRHNNDGPDILIAPWGEDEGARVVCLRLFSADIDEIFSPTFFFDPNQVEAGLFESTVKEIEEHDGKPGDIPRLAAGGLLANECGDSDQQ